MATKPEWVTAGSVGPTFYPVSIETARYGGAYEGGDWLAFPCHGAGLPEGWDDDDVTCSAFWCSEDAEWIGRGRTPNAALANMYARWADLT